MNKNLPPITRRRRTISIVVTLLLIIGLVYCYGTIYESSGVSYIADKEIIDNNYYIYLPMGNSAIHKGNSVIQLKCTEEEYKKIIVDENVEYVYSYKWSTLYPQKGNLLFLDLEDVIDNRDVIDNN